MANTKITLNRDELFKAIFQYVEKHYPVRADQAKISLFRGKIKEVTVDCEIKN
jgi:hypothetical protein